MILYYSCSNKPAPFLERTFARIRDQARDSGQSLVVITGHELAGATSQLVIHQDTGRPPWADLFSRIVAGIELAKPNAGEVVYLAEDDIIYPDEHFRGPSLPQALSHNFNVLYASADGFFTRYANCLVLSQYWGPAGVLYHAAAKKLEEANRGECHCVEPTGEGYPMVLRFDHPIPSVDIRAGRTFNHSWTAADALADKEAKFTKTHPEIGDHAEFWRQWNPERE